MQELFESRYIEDFVRGGLGGVDDELLPGKGQPFIVAMLKEIDWQQRQVWEEVYLLCDLPRFLPLRRSLAECTRALGFLEGI